MYEFYIILSNSTRKLSWREITKMLIAVIKVNLFFGTLSFLMRVGVSRRACTVPQRALKIRGHTRR